ncbi:hypothetical protein VCHENC02_1714, partial [Vibrio harveyi]
MICLLYRFVIRNILHTSF